uniref:Uncharacterized protein n=1 Tax=Trichuris muris TaxID=70415 RepID=A0A5S6QCA3_TRIMR
MWPQLSPDSVAMDVEQAAMNAFRATFPGAQRNLLRKDRSSTEFAVAAWMIVAMTFVLTNAIDDVFDDLSVQSPADLVPLRRHVHRATDQTRQPSGTYVSSIDVVRSHQDADGS